MVDLLSPYLGVDKEPDGRVVQNHADRLTRKGGIDRDLPSYANQNLFTFPVRMAAANRPRRDIRDDE